MDYKKTAEELFELLLTHTALVEDIDFFNFLYDRYPELMKDYVSKIEEEVANSDLPEISPEEDKRMYDGLMKKIEDYKISEKERMNTMEIKNSIFILNNQIDSVKNKGIIPCYVCIDGKYNKELSEKITVTAWAKKIVKGPISEISSDIKSDYESFKAKAMSLLVDVPNEIETSEALPLMVMSYQDKNKLDDINNVSLPENAFGEIKMLNNFVISARYSDHKTLIKNVIESVEEVFEHIPEDFYILLF